MSVCLGLEMFDDEVNIPRACIGQRFAKLELYMLTVKLVQRFKMEQDGPQLGCATRLVSVPDGPVGIRFTERLK